MVAFSPAEASAGAANVRKAESPVAKLLIGGLFGWTYEFVGGQYSNILKIGKQTQPDTSYLEIHRNLTKSKGLAAFWEGFFPWGSLMAVLKGSVFSSAHTAARNLLDGWGVSTSVAEIASGGMGGFVQGFVLSPTMLLMTRVITDDSFRSSGGLVETAVASAKLGANVVSKEGISGLMTGSLTFSCKRAADWTTRFFFVELIANGITKGEDRQLTWGETCVAGLGGGTMSAIATIPLDVAVSQLQQAKATGVGPLQIFTDKIAKEGMSKTIAFSCKGLVPRVAHVAGSTLLMKNVTSWFYQWYSEK